jgi:Na+/H+-dicarboxylate symporters
MDHKLTGYILAGLLLGVVVGLAVHSGLPEGSPALEPLAKTFNLLSDVFLNLIKLLVAPLVLSTVVAGIARMGDSGTLGRVGARALAWFITASFVAITLGLLMVNILEPGVGAPIPGPTETAAMVGEVGKQDFWEFSLSVVPSNALDALATNNILQILVFAILAGVALSSIGERGAPLVRGAEALAEMMLQITGYVMRLAPFAVFGAIAKVVATSGSGILFTYFELLFDFYLSLLLLWIVLIGMGWVVLRRRIWQLVRYIREPLLVAFATASSEAALPKMFEQLDRFGVPRRISGFTLPLGYSFNLDGSMMYMSFATIFIAQAYGIDLSMMDQALILLTLMISSKGIAAVPRASLVVITGTLAQFGLPIEGVALILAIDQFMDMGRTATNVVGNAVATGVITKWEGLLCGSTSAAVQERHALGKTSQRRDSGLDLQSNG